MNCVTNLRMRTALPLLGGWSTGDRLFDLEGRLQPAPSALQVRGWLINYPPSAASVTQTALELPARFRELRFSHQSFALVPQGII